MDMKNVLVILGMLAMFGGSLFGQAGDPNKVKTKVAVEKALSKVVSDIQRKNAAGAADEINAIKKRVLEATLEKVKLEVLSLSKSAQLGLMGSNVKNAPYSAEAITETRQVLEDGTRIEQRHGYKIYRDSQGRMRRESESGTEVWIVDPVANTSYVLDVAKQEARSMPLWVPLADSKERAFIQHKQNEQIIAPIDKNARFEPSTRWISLGRQLVEGVEAEGRQTVDTIGVGEIGNDRPIVITSETWYSPELQLQVKTRRYDPRSGESTFRLSNLRRGDPAPDLFRVPVNYRMVSGK
jgi:hypothetical protein